MYKGTIPGQLCLLTRAFKGAQAVAYFQMLYNTDYLVLFQAVSWCIFGTATSQIVLWTGYLH